MLTNKRKSIYMSAIRKFGKSAQIVVAIEELSELTKELTKTLREKCNLKNISEEMADVEIMLEQLKLIFKNKKQVEILKNYKIHRLDNYLKKLKEGETHDTKH